MSEPLEFRQMTPEEVREDQRDAERAYAQWQESICPCEEPDEDYLLGIEGGRIELRHQACGKRPHWYDDWEEDSFGEGIPVRVQITAICDCNPYVTVGHECSPEVYITPRSS